MTQKEIILRFKQNPYMLNMGANKLADWLKVSPDDIRSAKAFVRKEINNVALDKENYGNHRVLFIDIEISPIRAYVWRLWKQNVYLDQIISEWFCLSWSAKWANSDTIYNAVLTPEEAIREDDARIMHELWHILNQADTVVAHNGIAFDIKKINTRFLLNGLKPTRPFRVIDTLKVVRETFSFSSNKLDNILSQLNLDRKLDTSFSLWSKCMTGDEESLKYMSQYNDMDVIQLEEAFKVIMPWIKNFPHYGLFNEGASEDACPMCGSVHLKEDGYYTTAVSKYKLYRCESCGSISRDRKSIKIKLNKTNNLR